MCGGHLESDGARKAEMSMRWEKGGDSRWREVRVLSINKKSELNTRASLHANAKRESVTLSTSLYANVELDKSTTRGEGVRVKGKETGTFQDKKS